MYRALLFDLDGTLAETDPLHLPTWVDVLEPYGVGVDEEFYRQSISGRNTAEIIRDLLPDLSDEENRSVDDAKEARFRERASAGVRRFLVAPVGFVCDHTEILFDIDVQAAAAAREAGAE